MRQKACALRRVRVIDKVFLSLQNREFYKIFLHYRWYFAKILNVKADSA